MRNPMPVTTRIITAESGSSRNVRSTTKSPDAIHVYSVWSMTRRSGARLASCHTAITDTTNDANITSDARPPERPFDSRRPHIAFTTKPTNGKSGINDSTRVSLPLQCGEGIRVQRLPVTVQRDHDCQPDHRFGRRHGHHEGHDDLAVHGAVVTSEGQ